MSKEVDSYDKIFDIVHNVYLKNQWSNRARNPIFFELLDILDTAQRKLLLDYESSLSEIYISGCMESFRMGYNNAKNGLL